MTHAAGGLETNSHAADFGFDVLIVEDDVVQAEELSEFLSRSGYDVQTASGGSEGLHRAALRKPRIALLDYNLPDLDGATVAARIRSVSPGTTVVLMSGRIDAVPEATLGKLGLSAFMSKPLVLGEVRRLVERTLRAMVRTGAPLTEPSKRVTNRLFLDRILGRA
jgi:two-component system response regulator AtoC